MAQFQSANGQEEGLNNGYSCVCEVYNTLQRKPFFLLSAFLLLYPVKIYRLNIKKDTFIKKKKYIYIYIYYFISVYLCIYSYIHTITPMDSLHVLFFSP